MKVNLEEVKVINLTSKSIIVYRCSEPINRMHIEKLNEHLRGIFPNNTVLIMDKTSELSIVEPKSSKIDLLVDPTTNTEMTLCCEIEKPPSPYKKESDA